MHVPTGGAVFAPEVDDWNGLIEPCCVTGGDGCGHGR